MLDNPDISGVVLIESDFEGLVYLQAANGCDSVLSIRVQMLYESTHFVPSGFSPNGDGLNDFIGVMGGGIQENGIFLFSIDGAKWYLIRIVVVQLFVLGMVNTEIKC